jgi:hypothetical protein
LDPLGTWKPQVSGSLSPAGIGTFDWDLLTGRLDWDARLIEIFGHGAGAFDRSIDGSQRPAAPG